MISVIIPAYNAEGYICRCVDSLVSNYQGVIEVIIVDDGSKDSTPSLCDAISKQYPQTVTVLHKPNGGVQAARNLGYSVSRGEWVWFVDSDDVVAPGAINKLEEVLAVTSADAVYFGLVMFEDGEEPDWQEPNQLEADTISSADFISGTYSQIFNHYLWEYVFRKTILMKMSVPRPSGVTGPCREDFSYLDDLVFTEEFLRQAESVTIIPEMLYGYRQVGTSLTHAISPVAADSALRAVREIDTFEVADENLLPRSLMQIALLFNAYRAAGMGEKACRLRSDISREIVNRVTKVGLMRMPPRLLARYAALRTGVGDLILRQREK